MLSVFINPRQNLALESGGRKPMRKQVIRLIGRYRVPGDGPSFGMAEWMRISSDLNTLTATKALNETPEGGRIWT